MANNPAGINQINRVENTSYGQVKRQMQLTREAPISGAPVAAQAINTPRRSQKQATRGGGPKPPPTEFVPQTQPPPQPTYQAQLATVWQQIASVPGASPNVQQFAREAQSG